jgi:hypothetical protein
MTQRTLRYVDYLIAIGGCGADNGLEAVSIGLWEFPCARHLSALLAQAERRDRECPLWVISGHSIQAAQCPLYPQSGHSFEGGPMAAFDPKRTFDRALKLKTQPNEPANNRYKSLTEMIFAPITNLCIISAHTFGAK